MAKHSVGKLVLVVNDVEEIRDGIESLLTADGYQVDPARGEEEAVAAARRVAPDLILVSLDGAASEITAIALRIRERAGLSDSVPIVMFSITSIEEGAEVKLAGNAYLTRPDNFAQVSTLLRLLLGSPPAG